MRARDYPVHLLASNHDWNMMTKFSTSHKIQFYEHPTLLPYEQNWMYTPADKHEQASGRRFVFFVTNAPKKVDLDRSNWRTQYFKNTKLWRILTNSPASQEIPRF
jgi:hypothetical protein